MAWSLTVYYNELLNRVEAVSGNLINGQVRNPDGVSDATEQATYSVGVFLAKNNLSMVFPKDGKYYKIRVEETEKPTGECHCEENCLRKEECRCHQMP